MPASFHARLKEGTSPLFGTLITTASLEAAEVLAGAGFDWIWLDLEHSALGPPEAQSVLQAAAGRVEFIVRVPLNDEIWIKKILDTGAAGIMVPQVNTAEMARKAVRLSKYPPHGTRSIGVSRAHAFGPGLQDYIDRANDELVVIVQAEHVEAVKNIEEIVAVPGVDGVLIGPYDLSASMGLIGQVRHPEVQAAMERVRSVCQQAGMPLGVFTAGAALAKTYAAQGYRFIAAGSDLLLLGEAARGLLQDLRGLQP